VLSRLLRRAKKALPAEVVGRLGKETFRTLKKAASEASLSGCTGDSPAQRRESQKGTQRSLPEKLITITQASCAQAGRVVEALQKTGPMPRLGAC
jgi:hypothetical protein